MNNDTIMLVTNVFQDLNEFPGTEILVWKMTLDDLAILKRSQNVAKELQDMSSRGPEAARISVGEVFLFDNVPEEVNDSFESGSVQTLETYLGTNLSVHPDRLAQDVHFALVRPQGRVTLTFAEKFSPYIECLEDLDVEEIAGYFEGRINHLPDGWLALR